MALYWLIIQTRGNRLHKFASVSLKMDVLRLTDEEYYNMVQLLCIVVDVKFEDFEIVQS